MHEESRVAGENLQGQLWIGNHTLLRHRDSNPVCTCDRRVNRLLHQAMNRPLQTSLVISVQASLSGGMHHSHSHIFALNSDKF